eukprot:9940240-Alexandrium_andersonii.AAC.1
MADVLHAMPETKTCTVLLVVRLPVTEASTESASCRSVCSWVVTTCSVSSHLAPKLRIGRASRAKPPHNDSQAAERCR